MEEDTGLVIVSKEIAQEEGPTPQDNQDVVVRVQRHNSVPITHSGTIAKQHFEHHLEQLLKQMRRGDKWTLKGPRKGTLTVELLEIVPARETLSPLQRAEALKVEGNALVKAKDYPKAAKVYGEAFALVGQDPSAAAHDLRLSLVSNLALATLNSRQFTKTVEWCQLHLEQTVDPNVKVLFRMASAHKGLKKWWQARRDINLGIKHGALDDESVRSFNALLAQLEVEEKETKRLEKEFCGKMFK